MTTPVLSLCQVTKTYPGHPPVTALHGIDIRIEASELIAVVGASGSGKTTLLHLMAALEPPSSGSVRIDGQEVAGLPDPAGEELRSSARRAAGQVPELARLLGLPIPPPPGPRRPTPSGARGA